MAVKAQFLLDAGGEFESTKDYNGIHTQEHFWNFWDHQRTYKDIYSGTDGASIGSLKDLQLRSIEHIIPKSELSKLLRDKPIRIIYGARVNPLNMVPLHRGVNSWRKATVFDLDGDEVKEAVGARFFPFTYSHTGVDEEGEWVIPAISRGDIARAIMYMVAVYELAYLSQVELETLKLWSLHDPPNPTEQKWNDWVKNKFNISNPFIADPETYETTGEFLSLFQISRSERINNGSVAIVGIRAKASKERIYLENKTNQKIRLDANWALYVEPKVSATEFGRKVELDPSVTPDHFIILPPRKLIAIGFTKPNSLPNQGARITLMHLLPNINPHSEGAWQQVAQVQYD